MPGSASNGPSEAIVAVLVAPLAPRPSIVPSVAGPLPSTAEPSPPRARRSGAIGVLAGEPWLAAVVAAHRRAGHAVDVLRALEVDPHHCRCIVAASDALAGRTDHRGPRPAPDVPLLAMVPDASSAQRVWALRRGADDCVAVSAPLGEIVLRVARLAEPRGPVRATPSIVVGPLVVDVDHRAARVAGRVVPVTAAQMDLLVVLATGAGRLVPTERLLAAAWDAHQEVDRSLLRVQLARLRRALGPSIVIRSRRGEGYVLEVAAGVGEPMRPTGDLREE